MIPKIVHYCWLSGDPYPDLVQHCIDSWKKHLPDYEFVLWDTSRFDINQTEWTRQAFEKKNWAFVSDCVRFHALYNYGGVYLDSDVEVLKPFDDLLQQDYFFGYECASGLPEAACFGAVKGLPWLKKAIEFYENESFLRACDEGYWLHVFAPNVFKNVFEACENISLVDDGKIHEFNGGKIYPGEWFSPKTKDCSTPSPNSYAIHHFTNSNASTSSRIKRKIVKMAVSLLGEERYKRIAHSDERKDKRLLDANAYWDKWRKGNAKGNTD